MPPKKHKWNVLEARWFSGEFNTLEEMATKTKVPFSTIRKRSAAKDWAFKRAQLEQAAETQTRKKLATLISNERAKRIPGWFEMADSLKFKAYEIISKTVKEGGTTMTLAEATRALQAAYGIEADVLEPKSGRRKLSSEEKEYGGSPDSPETKASEEARRADLHRKLARLAAGKSKKPDN